MKFGQLSGQHDQTCKSGHVSPLNFLMAAQGSNRSLMRESSPEFPRGRIAALYSPQSFTRFNGVLNQALR